MIKENEVWKARAGDERFDDNLQTLSPQLSRNFPHQRKAPQRSKMFERRRERTHKLELIPPQKLHNHHKFRREMLSIFLCM